MNTETPANISHGPNRYGPKYTDGRFCVLDKTPEQKPSIINKREPLFPQISRSPSFCSGHLLFVQVLPLRIHVHYLRDIFAGAISNATNRTTANTTRSTTFPWPNVESEMASMREYYEIMLQMS